jgi:hypothetical protein
VSSEEIAAEIEACMQVLRGANTQADYDKARARLREIEVAEHERRNRKMRAVSE